MKYIRYILSIICGAAAFALFYSVFEIGILISLLAGAGGLLGSFLVTASQQIDPRIEEIARKHNIDTGTLRKVVRNGRNRIRKMKKLALEAENEQVKTKIEKIYMVTEKIYEDFESDPKDMRVARQFINYYLDTTIRIIEQYIALSKQENDENKKILKKAESVLDLIAKNFENQLQKLYEDDFLDLDTEVEVLEKSMKLGVR